MAASIRPGEDSGGVFVDCNSNGPPVILKTEPVVEDKNENGQAGQYFVDKVTGEYYFRSSNGDLEQLKEEPVQVEVKKRRGRPVGWRKDQTPPDADPDLTTGNPPDEQGVVKKKRGRPRKNKLDSDSSVLLAEGEDDQYEEVSTSTRSVIVPFSLKKF